MAVTDVAMTTEPVKRKEPETTEPEKAEKKDPPKDGEPEAKRLKPTKPEPAVVRKQVEYYLSDENLKHDKFFHEHISGDAGGWLKVDLVLSCKKMKAMNVTQEDLALAIKVSPVELREDGAAIRRPANAALPKLEARQMHQKKSSLHAHDGGVVSVFRKIPAEQSWTHVKTALQAKLPPKVSIWFVSEISSEKNQCFVATSPFKDDQAFFASLTLDLDGAAVSSEVCNAELLQQALKLLPKYVRERREKQQRLKAKDKNKPILIGTQKFINVGAVRGRVREILNSRSDGESLKPDGTDFKLIKALLGFHPRGEEKTKGMTGIKVNASTQGDNRCFWMVKEDGSEDDFSAKKCLDVIEANPPYAPEAEKKADKPPAEPKTAPKPPVQEASTATGAAVADDKASTKEGAAATVTAVTDEKASSKEGVAATVTAVTDEKASSKEGAAATGTAVTDEKAAPKDESSTAPPTKDAVDSATAAEPAPVKDESQPAPAAVAATTS